MVLPGHIAGGYLSTYALLYLLHPTLTHSEMYAIYFLGTLSGELPDIDIAFFAVTSHLKIKSQKSNHREFITHAPLFWLLTSSIISLGGFVFDSNLFLYGGLTLLTGTWSHFILDSIEFGIRWLWPFSNRRFFLIETKERQNDGNPASFSHYYNFIRQSYIKGFSFIAEILISLVALYFLFR